MGRLEGIESVGRASGQTPGCTETDEHLTLDRGDGETVLVVDDAESVRMLIVEVLEYHGIHTDHIAIRTSSYSGVGEHGKTVRVHAVDYLVSRLSAEDELLLPDYYVLDTDRWLVFPHEISGLTRDEILEHKPVDPNFFDPL